MKQETNPRVAMTTTCKVSSSRPTSPSIDTYLNIIVEGGGESIASPVCVCVYRESRAGSRATRALPEGHVCGREAPRGAWRGGETPHADQAGEHDGQPRRLPGEHGCVSKRCWSK